MHKPKQIDIKIENFRIFNDEDFHLFCWFLFSFPIQFYRESQQPYVLKFAHTQDVRIIVAVIFIHSNKNKLFYEVIKIAKERKAHTTHTHLCTHSASADDEKIMKNKTRAAAAKNVNVNKFRSIKKSWISIYFMIFCPWFAFHVLISIMSMGVNSMFLRFVFRSRVTRTHSRPTHFVHIRKGKKSIQNIEVVKVEVEIGWRDWNCAM